MYVCNLKNYEYDAYILYMPGLEGGEKLEYQEKNHRKAVST